MVFSTVAYFRALLHASISTPTGLTSIELILVIVGLIVTGSALAFMGNDAWKGVFSIVGLYFGGYLAYNIDLNMSITILPVILAIALGAIIGAVMLTFAPRAGIGFGFGALIYLVTMEFITPSFYFALLAGIIAMVLSIFIYKNYVHVVSAIVGSFAVYYSLLRLGYPSKTVEITAATIFVAGLIFQEYIRRGRQRKLEESRIHYHQSEKRPHVTASK